MAQAYMANTDISLALPGFRFGFTVGQSLFDIFPQFSNKHPNIRFPHNTFITNIN